MGCGGGIGAGAGGTAHDIGTTVLEEWGNAAPNAAKPITKPLKKYTWKEIEQHTSEDDCWIVIAGKVYNVSSWLKNHPGGFLPLLNMAGKDATDPFTNYHPASVWKKLSVYCIGEVADDGPTAFMKEYRKMREDLIVKGYFATNYWYYVRLGLWLLTLAATAFYLTLAVKNWFGVIGGALTLGLFWQQLSFVGHDLGHNAISHRRFVDHIAGLVLGNFVAGISFGWWKWSHNVHHTVCNSIEHDPDIQHLPFLAITDRIFKGGKFFSSYHNKWFTVDKFVSFLVSYQHYFYYLLMSVARVNLYIQSWVYIISTRTLAGAIFRFWELVLFSGFFVWYMALVSTLHSWAAVAVFVYLSHAVAGVLHVQITLSHFVMPAYHGHGYQSGNDDCWWNLQIGTTMDIDTSWWNGWFHGGLQYQIEHHLFPRIPRHNLPAVRPMVEELCRKNGIEYRSASFFTANKRLMGVLKHAAMAARAIRKGELSPEQMKTYPAPEVLSGGLLWDSLNARG